MNSYIHNNKNNAYVKSSKNKHTFPAHITQVVFLEGTWHSMLSPRIKKPVPPHHLHSTCPFEWQDEQETGIGCCMCKHRECYVYQETILHTIMHQIAYKITSSQNNFYKKSVYENQHNSHPFIPQTPMH